MFGFRLAAQRPPEPRTVADGVVMRMEHVYEIDPERMRITPQQDMPVWDTERIGDARREHLEWMHEHWADAQISGEELLED